MEGGRLILIKRISLLNQARGRFLYFVFFRVSEQQLFPGLVATKRKPVMELELIAFFWTD